MDKLIEIASRITELDRLSGELSKRRERKNAKLERDAQKGQFVEARSTYIDRVLKESGHSATIADDVSNELQTIRGRADPSWYPAIDYTIDNLIPHLDKQAQRSPQLRAALKATPYVIGAVAVAAYFGVAVFSRTPVTSDMETRAGLQQRAAAAEKAIRYDDLMDTRVRKGGWFKGLLFWPIEPNEAEVKSAAEFVSLVLEGQRYSKACASVLNDGERLSDSQLGMIGDVADYMQLPDIEWRDPPIMTVIDGLDKAEAC